MKKTFTFLVASLIATASFAQSGRYDRDARTSVPPRQQPPVVYDNHSSGKYERSHDSYNLTRERNAQIQFINREFDRRIDELRYRRGLNNRQRNRMVTALEKERGEKIQQVYYRYQDRNVGYSDKQYGRRY